MGCSIYGTLKHVDSADQLVLIVPLNNCIKLFIRKENINFDGNGSGVCLHKYITRYLYNNVAPEIQSEDS